MIVHVRLSIGKEYEPLMCNIFDVQEGEVVVDTEISLLSDGYGSKVLHIFHKDISLLFKLSPCTIGNMKNDT